MLEELHQFINRTPLSYSISMPRLIGYYKNLQRGTDRLVTRTEKFTKSPVPSAGIDFINSLITRADIPYLLKYSGNDMDLLLKVNNEYRSALYSDTIRSYPIHEKNFIYSKKSSTVEYLLLTDDFSLIQHLPIGGSETDWMQVRPVRMLSNDSPEIQLDIVTSRLRYRKTPPREVVFSINIMKLLMTYVKYRSYHPEEFTSSVNNYPFIFKTCLMPLLYDNVKNWMTKIIYDIVMMKLDNPKASYDASNLITGEKSTFIIGGRSVALYEVEDLINKCANGSVKPDEVMTSLWIALGINLYSEIHWLTDSNYIGNRGVQFRWCEFEREYFVLSTMIGIYCLQPDSDRTNELRKLFTLMARRLQNTRFAAYAKNPFIVAGIENKFDTLLEMMNRHI